MDVTFAVIGRSEAEVRAALRRLCEVFGVEALGQPSQVIGQDKWMGRARADDRTSGHGTAPAP